MVTFVTARLSPSLALKDPAAAEQSHAVAAGSLRASEVEMEPVARENWEWFGVASHLIVGNDCRFHLATIVGPRLVSTVGEWLPDSSTWDIFANSRGVVLEGIGDERRNQFLRDVGFVEIGAGRTYETMVFRTSDERCDEDDCHCGQPRVAEWGELDSDAYNERGDAQRGHYAMCDKWAKVPA
jgi:hypothetical protein